MLLRSCATQAAHRTGLCYQCGPAAPLNGLSICGQTCVDESSDINHCGSCGKVCTGDACNAPVCSGGTCSTTPTSGGSCTTASGVTGTCQSGMCDICAGTTPGSAQCSADNPCPSGLVCVNGGCFQDCTATFSCSSCIGDCFCHYTTDGNAFFCRDTDYYIGNCESDADCPQGSICDANIYNGDYSANLCTRPCPTYQPAS